MRRNILWDIYVLLEIGRSRNTEKDSVFPCAGRFLPPLYLCLASFASAHTQPRSSRDCGAIPDRVDEGYPARLCSYGLQYAYLSTA
ncbi:hypothetical protein V495_00616 [Pseudogymnoascus sp. VKM F-4514 (FW-929)]|nr:hypothetical protein V490_08117 [Pseudogymnoascus sp. VKM F-3557]KFY49374.1 hypothetical protein V495_00616 [Pseudogymnoascus sp. VKM F-4514 (FW-929)]KFY66041.1 hypothetical protein V497_01147 [Pseudogymnoascus sp. VKM F-4516 (FW-969)]